MPKFVRGRRFKKLSKEEQERNKDLVEKSCVTLDGQNRWMLTECAHSEFPEIQISPKLTCELCIWESIDTDAEYDPANEDTDSDYP